MGIVDLVVIITMVISVLFALYRGLLRELLGITSWILAGLGALYAYQPMTGLLQDRVDNVKVWAIVSCGLIALTILIIMTLFNAHTTHNLRKSALSGLDRTLGIAFGITRAALLIVLVWLFARQMAWTDKQMEQMQKNNLSVKYIQIAADWTEKILPDSMRKNMQRAPRSTPPTKPAVEYKNTDRESLDKMIESIVEIEE